MSQTDYSQPGRINWRLYKYISSALDELKSHIRIGGMQDCPDLINLKNQVELYASDYNSIINDYQKGMENIIKKYGDIRKTPSISVSHHIELTQLIMNTFHDIGTFRFHERNPYPKEREPDDYSLNVFSYDVSHVEKTPIVEKLTEFYYDELRREYENRSDHSRRKEAEKRAKRAYLFFQKYKQYEEGGFEKDDIEKIFGIEPYQQKIMMYWIKELLPYGLSTSLFGKAGMGKSNTSSFICQMVLVMKPNWDIITDLPFVFSPIMDTNEKYSEIKINRFYFVKNMSEMLMATAEIGLNDRIPAIIMDEFDSSIITDQMRSKTGRSLNKYMYLERHWDTQGPLFIYHTMKDIPVGMRKSQISHGVYMITTYTNYINRRTKKVVSNPESWMYNSMGGERYLPVPLTTLPYHAWGTSPFDMDVDIEWLNSHVTGTQKEALRQIRKLVPERGWDKELQKKQEKEREREEKEEERRKEKEEREMRESERRERLEQKRIEDRNKKMGKSD